MVKSNTEFSLTPSATGQTIQIRYGKKINVDSFQNFTVGMDYEKEEKTALDLMWICGLSDHQRRRRRWWPIKILRRYGICWLAFESVSNRQKDRLKFKIYTLKKCVPSVWFGCTHVRTLSLFFFSSVKYFFHSAKSNESTMSAILLFCLIKKKSGGEQRKKRVLTIETESIDEFALGDGRWPMSGMQICARCSIWCELNENMTLKLT